MISNTLGMLKSVKLSVKYDSDFLYTYLLPDSCLKAFCSPVLSLHICIVCLMEEIVYYFLCLLGMQNLKRRWKTQTQTQTNLVLPRQVVLP